MSAVTRRGFLQSAATLACGSAFLGSSKLLASPFGLPIGLQLYSVRQMLAKDYEGTLKKVASLGYQEVEAAGFYDHTPQQVKDAMNAAGLRCVSAHYSSDTLNQGFDKVVDFHKQLGVGYIVCSFPGHKDPERVKGLKGKAALDAFTIDDYKWNADQFNHWGQKAKAAGLKFGYHNHTMEFTKKDGVVPLDEMIRLTDPSLVTFELDCGWVVVGGANPVDYVKRYPTRISMLHVKDFKHTDKPASIAAPPPAAQLGQGSLDYKPVFEAAKKGQIKHYFVEQEGYDMPVFQALRIDAEYMKNLTA
jgi:sugar phosphate isomerase/epimerase